MSNCCGVIQFLLYSYLAILKFFEKAKLEETKFMKIATRLMVLSVMLVLGICANAQSAFTGPGPQPAPPIAVAL